MTHIHMYIYIHDTYVHIHTWYICKQIQRVCHINWWSVIYSSYKLNPKLDYSDVTVEKNLSVSWRELVWNTQKGREAQREPLGRELGTTETKGLVPGCWTNRRQGGFCLVVEFGSAFLYSEVFLEQEARGKETTTWRWRELFSASLPTKKKPPKNT